MDTLLLESFSIIDHKIVHIFIFLFIYFFYLLYIIFFVLLYFTLHTHLVK